MRFTFTKSGAELSDLFVVPILPINCLFEIALGLVASTWDPKQS